MEDFNSFKRKNGLKENVSNNGSFTWSNFRSNPIFGKLDGFLFLPEWETLIGSNVRQEICQRVIFDHCPIMLSI